MSEDPTTAGDVQDAALLRAVGELLDRVDPPPAWAVDLAKLSFDLRTIDAEFAELVADSLIDEPLLAVRSASLVAEPRLLTFESEQLVVELELDRDERSRPLLTGQLIPAEPARVELRQPGQPARSVPADALGRFRVDELADGPFSLIVHRPGGRPVASQWIHPA